MSRRTSSSLAFRPHRGKTVSVMLLAIGLSQPAHASLFSGETLDLVANILAWVVLFVAPIIVIGVFWMVHILPERIAEKRHHPQAAAIKMLCLLSLFFGGLLWPLAWLWAYSKPVLYKMAYGEDTAVPPHEPEQAPSVTSTSDGEVVRENATADDGEVPGRGGKRHVS